MLPAHPAVVHAILMDGLKTGIEEAVGDVFNAAEDFGGNPELVILRLKAHDADEFSPQAHHARDRAFDFGEGDVKGVLNPFRPVHDGGTEAIDVQAGVFQAANGDIKSRIGQIMQVGLRAAGHFQAAHFHARPAQIVGGYDLAFEGG